jgi:hypothetical protein
MLYNHGKISEMMILSGYIPLTEFVWWKLLLNLHNLRPVNTSMPLAVTNSSIYPNLASSGKTNTSCLTFAESRKLAMPDCQMVSLSSQTFSSTSMSPSAAEQTTGSDNPVTCSFWCRNVERRLSESCWKSTCSSKWLSIWFHSMVNRSLWSRRWSD